MLLKLIQYSATEYVCLQSDDVQEILAKMHKTQVDWVDIDLRISPEAMDIISQTFGLHPLTIEDIQNSQHIPKFEAFDNYFFVALKMFYLDKSDWSVQYEHLGLIIGDSYIATFQQDINKDIFDGLRNRIANDIGRVRKQKTDYLFARLIDTVVDSYTTIAHEFRQRIESLEEDLLNGKIKDPTADIFDIKREMATVRQYALPLRDVVMRLKSEPSPFIKKHTLAYLQDILDHLIQLQSDFDTYREMIKDLMDLHNSQLSNEMNKIMRTLTTISIFFMPLTFIAGVYGMNFDFIPELHWKYGYLFAWGTMAAVTLILYFVMKRKKWL